MCKTLNKTENVNKADLAIRTWDSIRFCNQEKSLYIQTDHLGLCSCELKLQSLQCPSKAYDVSTDRLEDIGMPMLGPWRPTPCFWRKTEPSSELAKSSIRQRLPIFHLNTLECWLPMRDIEGLLNRVKDRIASSSVHHVDNRTQNNWTLQSRLSGADDQVCCYECILFHHHYVKHSSLQTLEERVSRRSIRNTRLAMSMESGVDLLNIVDDDATKENERFCPLSHKWQLLHYFLHFFLINFPVITSYYVVIDLLWKESSEDLSL